LNNMSQSTGKKSAGLVLGILLILSFPMASNGDDKGKIKKLLEEVTGITDSDVMKAGSKKVLTLFDVYALAVKKTEAMAIEGEKYIQAETRKSQAIGAMLPRVSLRATKIYPETKTGTYPSSRTNMSLYARQPIITGLQEWYSYKGSQYEIRLRRYELFHNAGLFLMEVAQYFYRVLRIEQTLKDKEEIIALYKKTMDELRRRVRVGRSRQTEVLRVNTEIFKLEADIKSLQKELKSARMALSALSSISPKSILKEGELSGFAYSPEGLQGLMRDRWDIRAAREEVRFAETRLRVEQGGHLPTIYLEGYYRLYERDKTGRDYYGALGAELPLFSGGIVSARIREAESARRQAKLRLSRTLRNAETDIRDAYQRWESTQKEMEAYKNALVTAERNYRAIMREFRLNLVTILDVFTALTSLYNAREDYETIKLQNSLNRIRLGVAVSEFSGSDIQQLRDRSEQTIKIEKSR
jgi:outer membrane protein